MSDQERRQGSSSTAAADESKFSTHIPFSAPDPADDKIDDFRYDAFISYRHVELDRYWAKWLHTALETYRVPGALVRRLGIRPKIKRVFRDEEELPVSSDLTREIETAINHSRFLIVICSRQTPASRWVDAEVAHFRSLGRHNRILALLVDGEPGESFPKALVEIRRTITDGTGAKIEEIEAVEPLAADVRSTRQESTRVLARMAKIRFLACMLGCRFDDLRRRDEERSKKRRNYATAVLTTLAVSFAALAVWATIERYRAEAAERAAVTARDRTIDAYYNLAAVTDEMMADTPGTRRVRAELIEFALAKLAEIEPDTDSAERATGRTTAVGMRNRGHLFQLAGHTDDAQRLLTQSVEILTHLVAENPDDLPMKREFGLALHQSGLLNTRLGDTLAAQQDWRQALAIRQELADAEPANLTYQRDLAESLDYVGDAFKARGEDRNALDSYRRSLELRQKLADTDPDSADAKADLAEALINIGDMERKLGRPADALPPYRAASDLLVPLRAADPYGMRVWRMLAIAENKIGGTAFVMNDLPAARAGWERALGQIRELAAADLGNLDMVRELSLCLRNLGLVEEAMGDIDSAVKHYEESLGRARALVNADRSNALAARNLAGVLETVAKTNWRLGRVEAAAAAHRDLVTVRQTLADLDTANAAARHEYEEALADAATVLHRAGMKDQARAYLQTLRDRLETRSADPVELSRVDLQLARLETGEPAVQRLQAIVTRLDSTSVSTGDSAKRLLSLNAHAFLGEHLASLGRRAEAADACSRAAALLEGLDDSAEPDAQKALVRTLASLANGVMFERPAEALPLIRQGSVIVARLERAGALTGPTELAWPEYFKRTLERLEAGPAGAAR